MSLLPSALQAVRSNPLAIALVAVGLTVAAIPFTGATHLSGGGTDIQVDVRAGVTTVTIPNGTDLVFPDVFVPTAPAGAHLRARTMYDLTTIGWNIGAVSNGWGYVGSSSALLEIVNGSIVVAPAQALVTGPDGPGGVLRNASWIISSSMLTGPGIYGVRIMDTSTIVGQLVVLPAEDITVALATNPSFLLYDGNTKVISVDTTVPGSIASSNAPGLLAEGTTTDGSGDLVFASSLPMGAGRWTIFATQDTNPGGAQYAPGTSNGLPERMGSATLEVHAGELGVVWISDSPGVGTSDPVSLRPIYPATQAPLFQTGFDNLSVLAWNLSVVSPANVLFFVNSSAAFPPASIDPEMYTCLDLGSPNATPGPCTTSPPSISIDPATGNVTFADSPWGAGTHSYRLALETAGGAMTPPDHTTSWEITPTGIAPNPTFRIGAVLGSTFAPVTTPIRLENVSNFGSATLRLTFDPNVVTVSAIENGDIPGANMTVNLDNAAGTLDLLLTTSARPGEGGSFTFARVTLTAAGQAGTTSALDLTLIELVDSDGLNMTANVIDGTYRAAILGDADDDGDVDAFDVLAIADVVVGNRPLSSIVLANADVTHDGVVTGRDAMFVRQHLAGTRPVL